MEFNDFELTDGYCIGSKGKHSCFPNKPLFILGKHYLLPRVDFNSGGEMWVDLESADGETMKIRLK